MALALRRAVWVSVPWIVTCVAIAAGVWAIVNGIENYHKGIYAGFHFGDAKGVVQREMISKYGLQFASEMRFADPPVVNVHQYGLLSLGQVRIFHVIGPRGARYCVSVWHPGTYWTAKTKSGTGKGINIGGESTVKKGCSF